MMYWYLRTNCLASFKVLAVYGALSCQKLSACGLISIHLRHTQPISRRVMLDRSQVLRWFLPESGSAGA